MGPMLTRGEKIGIGIAAGAAALGGLAAIIHFATKPAAPPPATGPQPCGAGMMTNPAWLVQVSTGSQITVPQCIPIPVGGHLPPPPPPVHNPSPPPPQGQHGYWHY
jgi:hypothetical protein